MRLTLPEYLKLRALETRRDYDDVDMFYITQSRDDWKTDWQCECIAVADHREILPLRVARSFAQTYGIAETLRCLATVANNRELLDWFNAHNPNLSTAKY